ncbi:MAG: insulinase family protein [Lysobacterales bacterium]
MKDSRRLPGETGKVSCHADRARGTIDAGKRLASLRLLLLSALLLCFLPGLAPAYLDMSAAQVEKLGNGLTVIVLEDHSFPVVSVQMLYKSGARDESTGTTGLAHFLEHMAFRATENFPDTEVVSSIYAAGGEWHGYTWLDQTTYYATVPKADLGLLLRIEADRMARLEIPSADLDSERGAVLTEMHSYENDPAIVLQDNVLYLAFLAHPYRNNTIGWESDIANITHADLVNFYHRHYQPANAVLAIAGDVRFDEVMQQVRQNFADLEAHAIAPVPYTVEPVQKGERRVRLEGEQDRKYFKIAYHAPSVNNPDYAAFLLTQDLLAAGSGVSFLQNDWGTPARPDSPLGGVCDDLTTWFPPSAGDYVFMISGSLPADGDEKAVEVAIEAGIDRLRRQFSQPGPDAGTALKQARERVLRELTFDVQTTEDAAHQLAFFEGLDALGVLVNLKQLLAQVGVADIERVLDRYLRREQRTVGWSVPATGQDLANAASAPAATVPKAQWEGSPKPAETPQESAAPGKLYTLGNGTPVIIQRSPLSPTAMLKVLVPSADFSVPAGVDESQPAWGLASLDIVLLPGELETAIRQARDIIGSARPWPTVSGGNAVDPAALLESTFRSLLGLQNPDTKPAGPILLIVSGDIDPARVLEQLENGFGHTPAAIWPRPEPIAPMAPVDLEKHVDFPVAQEQLGYVVQVPGPREETRAAWQIALYTLTHGYEGRLGKAAISQRGLVYYIDSAYHTDGTNDWITLSTGVDPQKLTAMKELLRQQLDLMLTRPPSAEEIEAARSHLLGRFVSAAQSNAELAENLASQWILYGHLPGYDDLKRQLDAVSRQDIMQMLPAFTHGAIVSVRNPPTNSGE